MYRLNRGITGSWWLVALNFYLWPTPTSLSSPSPTGSSNHARH